MIFMVSDERLSALSVKLRLCFIALDAPSWEIGKLYSKVSSIILFISKSVTRR